MSPIYLLYIISRHYAWTFRRAGDMGFHSNLISMSKGVSRPCMPIKVIVENVYVVLIAV